MNYTAFDSKNTQPHSYTRLVELLTKQISPQTRDAVLQKLIEINNKLLNTNCDNVNNTNREYVKNSNYLDDSYSSYDKFKKPDYYNNGQNSRQNNTTQMKEINMPLNRPVPSTYRDKSSNTYNTTNKNTSYVPYVDFAPNTINKIKYDEKESNDVFDLDSMLEDLNKSEKEILLDANLTKLTSLRKELISKQKK